MLAFPDCCHTDSTHPSGCLNLAASKAEPFPELEVAEFNVLLASDPKAALLGRIHSLFSEEVRVSGTGGSSAAALAESGDAADSSGATAGPVLEASSGGAAHGDSPLTEKGKSVRQSIKQW